MFLAQTLDQSASSGDTCNMMVPRAFLFSSARAPNDSLQNEKKSVTAKTVTNSRHTQSRPLPPPVATVSVSHTDSTTVPHTSPVVIPPKTSKERNNTGIYGDNRNVRSIRRDSASSRRSASSQTQDRNLPPSLSMLLETTAIPRRSKSIRGARKLPRGNHVEDFSRLLMDGVKTRDDFASLEGASSSPLDILLSPPDENYGGIPVSVSNSSTDVESPHFERSISTDSVPSLDQDLNSFITSGPTTPSLSPSLQRRTFERRKQLSPPQECATDHPLLEIDIDTFDPSNLAQESDSAVGSPENRSRSFPRLGFTFKSNLTASLRAIKSAAQTVSNFATPSVRPDDFLTRSLFSITPELTDDRRPLPLSGPPSPALRRYLNPITLSPAEMHVYNDHPHDTLQGIAKCPVSIQMQTYNHSDSKSTNHQQACAELPSSRQREPRENSDFLRMVVLEMNMRRSGKLRDDAPTRARIWLPPRKAVRLIAGDYEEGPAVPQRWIGISIERIEP
ncbi:conserved hypothetical protein [Talaromyces stipitatus ATCC 10500]|uniref:Uncharacterized protein n=1 Tax=Talaromyces stipitatus (strain ATCC 10500 / CBS 375.48 / QM 6759 / NRRL 1006) TaxID=441959 RepID=B8LXG6_TALSN|nr:uncharacterized protein TSTA_066890 [Talaromyces stipitatus ATCC 10500]EED23247.1 conserved hypothetical protein [Talaromyces stipitatus ATCC 10500]